MDEVLVRTRARTRFPALPVALFLTTVATTLWTGFELAVVQTGLQPGTLGWGWGSVLAVARAGLPFAASVVAILLSHEMGHYLLARWHRVDATLPFFIPVPFGFGTLGAVIRIRSLMPSRRAVLDIGAAGPIAGFVVAFPLLLWGYAHSPPSPVDPSSIPWPSAINLVREWMGQLPAQGDGSAMFFGRSLVTLAALRLTHPGMPLGAEVSEHPVAIAAWFGMFVTALNLIPIGQLDGGHLSYALLGRERARKASRAVSWALLAVGVTVSWTWLVWWAFTRFAVGLGHPPALDERPLGRGRSMVALLGLVLFAVTFTPIPARFL